MPVSRLRQIVGVIRVRLESEQRLSLFKWEWQTRKLAEFIAASAFTDESGHRKLLAAVDRVRLLPRDEEKKKEPEPGSFERLTGLFTMPLRG